MLATLLALGGDEGFLGIIGAVVIVVGSVLAVVDRQKKSLTESYKGLYETQSEKVKLLEEDLAKLHAQVEILTSDFTKSIAEGVTAAVFRLLDERRPT